MKKLFLHWYLLAMGVLLIGSLYGLGVRIHRTHLPPDWTYGRRSDYERVAHIHYRGAVRLAGELARDDAEILRTSTGGGFQFGYRRDVLPTVTLTDSTRRRLARMAEELFAGAQYRMVVWRRLPNGDDDPPAETDEQPEQFDWTRYERRLPGLSPDLHTTLAPAVETYFYALLQERQYRPAAEVVLSALWFSRHLGRVGAYWECSYALSLRMTDLLIRAEAAFPASLREGVVQALRTMEQDAPAAAPSDFYEHESRLYRARIERINTARDPEAALEDFRQWRAANEERTEDDEEESAEAWERWRMYAALREYAEICDGAADAAREGDQALLDYSDAVHFARMYGELDNPLIEDEFLYWSHDNVYWRARVRWSLLMAGLACLTEPDASRWARLPEMVNPLPNGPRVFEVETRDKGIVLRASPGGRRWSRWTMAYFRTAPHEPAWMQWF